MGSPNKYSKTLFLFFPNIIAFSFSVSAQSKYPLSTLQNRMLEKPISQSLFSKDELAKKYGLVRLWPLSSNKNLIDDSILGSSLINTSFHVKPLFCGDSIYAKFENKGMIKSDESIFLYDYFNENKPSQLDTDMYKVKKGMAKLSEWFPNYLPSMTSDNKNNIDSNLIEKYKDKIQYSSSMVSVDRKENQLVLKDTGLNSVLEIGSIEPGQAYSGYMRGLYLSKKALREREVLDLAAKYYPNDSTHFCTYNKTPKD